MPINMKVCAIIVYCTRILVIVDNADDDMQRITKGKVIHKVQKIFY